MIVSVKNITFYRFFICLVTILFLDYIWFSSSKSVYPNLINIRIGFGFIAWGSLVIAIISHNSINGKQSLIWGGLVGLIIYNVFNGTELAIRPDWTLFIAIVDILWGIIICSISSLIVNFLTN